jgi:hypothetical protein
MTAIGRAAPHAFRSIDSVAQFAVFIPTSSFHIRYYGKWFNETNEYFGFKFSLNGKTHYGWGRMTTSAPYQEGYLLTASLTGSSLMKRFRTAES